MFSDLKRHKPLLGPYWRYRLHSVAPINDLSNSEKAMATHSSTLAWKVPWMEEPGGLQSMGSQRVGHDWAISLSLFLSCIGEGNGNPLQCSCLENPRDRGAWWAAVCGVAQSQTWLKRLSSSSSSSSRVQEIVCSKIPDGCVTYRSSKDIWVLINEVC